MEYIAFQSSTDQRKWVSTFRHVHSTQNKTKTSRPQRTVVRIQHSNGTLPGTATVDSLNNQQDLHVSEFQIKCSKNHLYHVKYDTTKIITILAAFDNGIMPISTEFLAIKR
jgi:hypothetical protein